MNKFFNLGSSKPQARKTASSFKLQARKRASSIKPEREPQASSYKPQAKNLKLAAQRKLATKQKSAI